MNSERKKLYMYSAVNFIIGIMLGIILFYGQIKNFPEGFFGEYSYDKTPQLLDLIRVAHLNIMWLFSAFMARSILPAAPAHPILLIRGLTNSFSAMYIMKFIGIREAVFSVFPQCLSFIPVMMYFSVLTIEKRRKLCAEGREPSVLCRLDCVEIIICGILAAIAEMLVFIILLRIFG